MNIDELIDRYCTAWSEPDSAKRYELLEAVLSPIATYTDPTVADLGPTELSAHIRKIQATRPGAQVRRTTAVDAHHDVLRFGFEVVDTDGVVLRRGIDVVVLDAQHAKIRQITGFFGDLVESRAPAPLVLSAIGHVESPLRNRSEAPKQGEEGSPLAVLVFDASVKAALESIRVGARLLLLTWLDRADRTVLQVHPRDDVAMPLKGVFSTRSQDRPNPIGVHRVTVTSIRDPLRFEVPDLEAFHGTPIVDVKATLEGVVE